MEPHTMNAGGAKPVISMGGQASPIPPKTPVEEPKKGKWPWWVAIAAVIVVGLWLIFFYSDKASAPAPIIEGEPLAEEETVDGPAPKLLWEFAPAGGNSETGAFRTSVKLTANGETHDLGSADGSCSIVDAESSWKLVENELTGVICYFAGAGTEFGVFNESGTYVVKQGVIEEGTAEEPGMRGDYEVLFTL